MDVNVLAVAATFVVMAAVVVKRSVEDRRARRLGGGLIDVRLPGDGSRPDAPAHEGGTRLADAAALMAVPRSALLVGTAAASVAMILAASVALAQSPSAQPEGDVTPTGPVTTVVGTEYAFSGLPESVPAGTTFGFTNQGAELHQLLVVQKNEGVTETWDELMALPEAEANSKVTFIGQLIAGPGKASPDTFTIAEPGRLLRGLLHPPGRDA